MGLDVDFIAGDNAIKKLKELLSNQEHGEREEIADEIIEFTYKMMKKYGKQN